MEDDLCSHYFDLATSHGSNEYQRLAKIQEVQHRLNMFVENRGMRAIQTLNTFFQSNIFIQTIYSDCINTKKY